MRDAYLFDIDGTLLRCRDRIHVDAFFSSVRAVMGRDLVLDGVTLSGNTDPGILRDAFRLAELEDEHWQPHLEDMLAADARRMLARRSEMKIDKMPGVDEVLRHLHAERRGAWSCHGTTWNRLDGQRSSTSIFVHWFVFGGSATAAFCART